MYSLCDVIAAKNKLRRELLGHDRHASGLSMYPPDIPSPLAKDGRLVHSVGVGKKVVGGRETDAWAVRVYVRRKLPVKSLRSKDSVVPKAIEPRNVPTDVVELPPPAIMPAASMGDRLPAKTSIPLVGGVAILHENGPLGTLGLISRFGLEKDRGFLIGNNHILGNSNQGKPGDALFHPDRAGAQVGTFVRSVPLNFSKAIGEGSPENHVDFAFGDVSVDHMPDTVYPSVKIGGPLDATKGLMVSKHGFASGATSGLIDDIAFDTVVTYGEGRLALFVDQLKISSNGTPFAAQGDSGSIVWCQDTNCFVGMIFAVTASGDAIASPASAVVAALKSLA